MRIGLLAFLSYPAETRTCSIKVRWIYRFDAGASLPLLICQIFRIDLFCFGPEHEYVIHGKSVDAPEGSSGWTTFRIPS